MNPTASFADAALDHALAPPVALQRHEINWIRAAAQHTRRVYPDAIGELIARELDAHVEFGYCFDAAGAASGGPPDPRPARPAACLTRERGVDMAMTEEIRRCLKRYIARQLHRFLTAAMTPAVAT